MILECSSVGNSIERPMTTVPSFAFTWKSEQAKDAEAAQSTAAKTQRHFK
jgi:hypothetical protein